MEALLDLPLWQHVVLGVVMLVAAVGGVAQLSGWIRTRREASEARAWRPPSLLPHTPYLKRGAHVFALVNPIGGTRRGGGAVGAWGRVVKPMLDTAGVTYEFVVTQRQGHARELACELARQQVGGDPSATSSSAAASAKSKRGARRGTSQGPAGEAVASKHVDLVLVVGGDGLLHETLNGLVDACDNGADPDAVKAMLHALPIGVVPAGTSNGVAASMGNRELVATMHMLLTSERPVDTDVYSVDVGASVHPDRRGSDVDSPTKRAPVWDCHVTSWAMVADHDKLVETTFRVLGKTIKEIYTPVHVIMLRRAYRGRCFIQPAPLSNAERERIHYRDAHALPLTTAADAGLDDESVRGAAPAADKFGSRITQRAGEGAGGDASGYDDRWRVLEGEFLLWSVCNLRDGSHDVQLAPAARLDDGAVDLLTVRTGTVGRAGLIRTFMGMEDGSFVHEPFVEMFKCRRVALEPHGGLAANTSGEDLPGLVAPLHVTSQPGVGSFLYTPESRLSQK